MPKTEEEAISLEQMLERFKEAFEEEAKAKKVSYREEEMMIDLVQWIVEKQFAANPIRVGGILIPMKPHANFAVWMFNRMRESICDRLHKHESEIMAGVTHPDQEVVLP